MSPATLDPTTIELADPDGNPVRFADLAADPLVVILVRYFGCLPCQAFVQDVDTILDDFPDTAKVVAVGGSADYQAQWLRDTKDVRMPLLLDPDLGVRWTYEGTMLGDYPSVDELLRQANRG